MRKTFGACSRATIASSAFCLGLIASNAPTRAQDSYPSKPIQLVVTTAAGGALDLIARTTAERLTESMRQPIIIENQPAGNGSVAAGQFSKATPDGHTLMMVVDSTVTINPHLYRNLPYDPFRDFAPVSVIGSLPLVLIANPAVPANDLRELIAYARANPGRLSYAFHRNRYPTSYRHGAVQAHDQDQHLARSIPGDGHRYDRSPGGPNRSGADRYDLCESAGGKWQGPRLCHRLAAAFAADAECSDNGGGGIAGLRRDVLVRRFCASQDAAEQSSIDWRARSSKPPPTRNSSQPSPRWACRWLPRRQTKCCRRCAEIRRNGAR